MLRSWSSFLQTVSITCYTDVRHCYDNGVCACVCHTTVLRQKDTSYTRGGQKVLSLNILDKKIVIVYISVKHTFLFTPVGMLGM